MDEIIYEELVTAIENKPIDLIELFDYQVAKRELAIEKLEQILSDKKDEMFIIVEQEYESDKKNPFLSNAEKRKKEVKDRLKQDQEYLDIDDQLYDLKEIQMVEKVRLAALRRRFIRECCQNRIPI